MYEKKRNGGKERKERRKNDEMRSPGKSVKEL